MNRRHFASLLALCLVVALPLAAPAQAEEDPAIRQRTFEFRALDREAAEALVRKSCPAKPADDRCQVVSSDNRNITVRADLATLARIAAAIGQAENLPGSQVFQVILLEAVNNGDTGLDRIPEQARGALTVARDFPPYSGYRLLDTALLRTDARAQSVVDGPDGHVFRASLTYDDAVTLDGHRLVIRQFAVDRIVSALASSEAALEHLPVLGTSFTMRPGETVIVGTSKLEGAGRALVVLLTNVQ